MHTIITAGSWDIYSIQSLTYIFVQSYGIHGLSRLIVAAGVSGATLADRLLILLDNSISSLEVN